MLFRSAGTLLDTELIVNATPLGMSPETDGDPFDLTLFAFLRLAPNMLYLSAIGTIYGGWAALCQKNLHRLLAHVLICNIALVTLGVFSGAAQSLQGSVLHLIHLSLLCTGLCPARFTPAPALSSVLTTAT